MKTELAINDLMDTEWLSGIGKELKDMHERHGMPEPQNGNSAHVRWPTYCEDPDLPAYNLGLRAVFEVIGVRYKNGLYVQSSDPGSQSWVRFQKEAVALIEDWIAYSAMEEFTGG